MYLSEAINFQEVHIVVLRLTLDDEYKSTYFKSLINYLSPIWIARQSRNVGEGYRLVFSTVDFPKTYPIHFLLFLSRFIRCMVRWWANKCNKI